VIDYQVRIEGYEGGGMPELLYLRTIKDLFQGGVAIDVGANVGEISYFFMTLGIDEIQAFEPNPKAFAELEKLAPHVITAHRIALSSVQGKAELLVPFDRELGEHNSGLSTLSPEWLDYLHDTRNTVDHSAEATAVTLEKLDSYKFDNVKIIKIDVEGHESEVLLGALDTIKHNRPLLVIEIVNNPTVFDIMAQQGYYCYWYDRKSRYVTLLNRHYPAPGDVYNFIFVPQEVNLPTLKAEKTIAINSVQGIGDLMWVYRKVAPHVDKMDITVLYVSGHSMAVQRRAAPFLRCLPKVNKIRFREAQPWFYGEVASGKYTLDELFTGKHELTYAVNRWLEEGVQLDDIEPELDVLWDLDLKATSVEVPENYLLVYVSGSGRHDGTTQLAVGSWVKMILTAVEKLGVKDVVFTGAEYDLWKTDEVIKELGDRVKCTKLFNEITETFHVIQKAKYFIAYQSGLCMLSEEFGIPTFMIWSPSLPDMKTSWMRKSNAEKQLFGHCFFNESAEEVSKKLIDHVSLTVAKFPNK